MSKLSKEQRSEAEVAMARMKADDKTFETVGVLDAAASAANSNIDEAILEDGEILTVPALEELDDFMFAHKFGRGKGYGVVCPSSTGMSKRLYFNSLKKRVVVYDETTKLPVKDAEGKTVIVQSDSEISKQVRLCPTMADVAKYIAGKKIQFKKIEKNGKNSFVTATRDADNRVTGTRETSVFEPTFVD